MPVRPSPPPPRSRAPRPPCGVVRCGAVLCGAVPCCAGAVRCGAVRCGAGRGGAGRGGAFPPCLWCGGLVGVVLHFPPWNGVPSLLGLLWFFGIFIPIMMMGTMITVIMTSSILMFDWLVVGCLLLTYLVFFVLLIVGLLLS